VIVQQAEMTLSSCISGWRHEADKLYWAGGAGDEADELSAALAQNTTKKLKPAGHLKPPQATSSHLRLFGSSSRSSQPAGLLTTLALQVSPTQAYHPFQTSTILHVLSEK
jgi:hypothetical protein